eukprot:TRINITY_DN23900_c0_g1_i1.p1 TRINITY_DN23900_c0_g1~~TRINITY_DN23900_c0_g1_i1.p1  ORF type:complete len:695 (-),score=195.63 TRINITY_DN23900_c0_g1_i1:203-2287(-)
MLVDSPEIVEKEWLRFRERMWTDSRMDRLVNDEHCWDLRRLEKACKICWQMSNETVKEAEIRRLKELCHRTMLDLENLKERLWRNPEHNEEENSVELYEPLNYLDAQTKDVVLLVLSHKVRQILKDKQPANLIRAIAEAGHMDVGGWKEKCIDAQERLAELEAGRATMEKRVMQALKDTKQAQEEKEVAEKELEASQEREVALQEELVLVRMELAETTTKLQEAEAEIQRLTDANEKLMEELEETKRQLEHMHDQYKAAVEEVGVLKLQLSETKEQSTEAFATIEKLEAELEEIRQEVNKLTEQAEEHRQVLQALEERAVAAEAEAADLLEKYTALRESLDNKKERSVGTSTELKMEEVGTLQDRAEKQKVKLADIDKKLSELAIELSLKGLESLLGSVGLKASYQIHDRLFVDAVRRTDRMVVAQEEAKTARQINYRTDGEASGPSEAVFERDVSGSSSSSRKPTYDLSDAYGFASKMVRDKMHGLPEEAGQYGDDASERDSSADSSRGDLQDKALAKKKGRFDSQGSAGLPTAANAPVNEQEDVSFMTAPQDDEVDEEVVDDMDFPEDRAPSPHPPPVAGGPTRRFSSSLSAPTPAVVTVSPFRQKGGGFIRQSPTPRPTETRRHSEQAEALGELLHKRAANPQELWQAGASRRGMDYHTLRVLSEAQRRNGKRDPMARRNVMFLYPADPSS